MAKHHANRGRAWEALLEVMHTHYQKTRRALVVRCYPEMRNVDGHWVQIGAGPPDYVLLAGGLTVLIEAKQVAIARWAFSLLKDHQALQLDAAERQGAHGAVLLRFSTAGRTCLLLWRTLGPLWWRWKRGEAPRASLTLDDAIGIACWNDRGADYLQHLLVALRRGPGSGVPEPPSPSFAGHGADSAQDHPSIELGAPSESP